MSSEPRVIIGQGPNKVFAENSVIKAVGSLKVIGKTAAIPNPGIIGPKWDIHSQPPGLQTRVSQPVGHDPFRGFKQPFHRTHIADILYNRFLHYDSYSIKITVMK